MDATGGSFHRNRFLSNPRRVFAAVRPLRINYDFYQLRLERARLSSAPTSPQLQLLVMNVENNRGASSADEPWEIHTSAVLIPYHSTAASRLVEVTVRAMVLAGIPVAAHGVSSLFFANEDP